MKRILCLALFVALALAAPVFAANAPDKSGEIGFDVAQANVSSSDTSGAAIRSTSSGRSKGSSPRRPRTGAFPGRT